jgi:hypothetical protein
MPETRATEFWEDMQLAAKVLQTDARPEAYSRNAPTDDEWYAPFTGRLRCAAASLGDPMMSQRASAETT